MSDLGPYAFVDEYGDPNLSIELGGTTGVFIVTAVVVEKDQLAALTTALEAIRRVHFQSGEMKSQNVGANDERRERVLLDLGNLPFAFASLVVSKDEINKASGLGYRQSFFKWVHGLLYRRLFSTYSNIVVYADEYGRQSFMDGFVKYVERKHIPTLFKQRAEFYFATADTQPILQIADFISGTLARYYDPKKWTERAPAFLGMLRERAMVIDEWPPIRRRVETAGLPGEAADDKLVRELCVDAALLGLDRLKDAVGEPEVWQREVLAYLLFHFRWISEHEYVPTKKILTVLGERDYSLTERLFRSEVIAPLRDSGVILSPSPQGYKIPATRKDLLDFVAHADNIVGPMLDRLQTARSKLLMASMNRLDILAADNHAYLRELLDKRRGIQPHEQSSDLPDADASE